ncbi:MAG: flavin reductase family protein [Lachnospiraceae bacterium]|jgi:flavin reductase (DIM6/NTAB) family NADH-FMN oxidoreductase RutF
MTEIKKAMSHMTQGTYVIGTKKGKTENLMTAAWLSQVSSNPPSLVVAVGKTHLTAEYIAQTKKFTVSMLAEEQKGVARRCGTVSGRDADKVSREQISHDSAGLPLIQGAAAHVSCILTKSIDIGDHILFVGEVVEGVAFGKTNMIYNMETIMNG